MPLSNSVIRRYTPPTCTLEVLAQDSPLSRWMGKTVLKQLSFELRFDDPRLPEESRLPIRGDRDQLEALCDAVTSYVQEFLQQSPESFWLSFAGPQDSSKVADDSQLTDFPPISLPVRTQTLQSFPSQFPPTKIYLEPSSYLSHKLFLGSLANQTSGPVIQLSLLQLFDLATALDEYSADIMALPTLEHTRSSVASFPAWAPVAAVLVLGVGLLPITWQYVNQTKSSQQQVAKTPTTESDQIALQALPSPSPNPQTGLTPPDTLALPPIPPAGSIQPSPAPLATTEANPANIPNSPLLNNPALSQPQPNTTANSPTPNLPTSGSGLIIPPATSPNLSNIPQLSAPITSPNQPTTATKPNPKTTIPGAISQAEIDLPNRRELPSSLSGSRSTVSPNISTAPPLPTIPNERVSKLQGDSNSGSTTSSARSSQQQLVGRLRAQSTPSPTEVSTDSTLFDTPQVAEARQYLQQRWRPPTGFNQTLEYSLMLGVDGTVERILPLNKAARDYVETTGMPNIGEPFVSPNRYGRNVRLRAVLSPGGKVQILPETE
jgi:hypothetical protein